MTPPRHEAVAIGCSLGGLQALRTILRALPAAFPLPVVVVSHVGAGSPSLLTDLLGQDCALPVVEAEDKAPVLPGHVHVAPSGYHLLVEADRTFSLSVDAKVCHVRPAIDVLFESAADVWGRGLIGIVLTGANDDGSRGLKAIHDAGGLGLVQDPATAEADVMPRAAIAAGGADRVAALGDLAAILLAALQEVP